MKLCYCILTFGVVVLARCVIAQDADNILAGLPEAAVQSYQQASYIPYSPEADVELRKWLRTWGKYMRDPYKALVELDFAEFLLQKQKDTSQSLVSPAHLFPGFSIQKQEEIPRWSLNIKTAQQIIVGVKTRRPTDARVVDKLAEVQESARKAEYYANNSKTSAGK